MEENMNKFHKKDSKNIYRFKNSFFSVDIFYFDAESFYINNDRYKIILVLEGKFELLISEKNIQLKKGDVFIINPHKVYGLTKISENNLILSLDLKPSEISKKYSMSIPVEFSLNYSEDYGEKFISLFKQFIYMHFKSSALNKENISLLFEDLIDILLQDYISNEMNTFIANKWIENELIKIVNDMFDGSEKNYTLDEISRKLNNYPSNISKYFKKIFGCKFVVCSRFAKLKKSIELLRYTEKNISEISNEIGFASSKSLCENYNKYLSMTPSFFRENLKKSKKIYHELKLEDIVNSKNFEDIFRNIDKRDNSEINFLDSKKERIAKIHKVDLDSKLYNIKNSINHLACTDNLEDDWIENVSDIQNNIKYELLKIDIIFDKDGTYYVRNFSKCEKLDSFKLTNIVCTLEKMGVKPLIVLEVSKKSVLKRKSGKNHFDFDKLEKFLGILTNLVPSSQIKNWYFEIKMPWLWEHCGDSDINLELHSHLFKEVHNIISKKIEHVKLGIHVGDNYILKNDRIISNMKKIAFSCSKPQYVSFDFIDSSLFFSNIDENNSTSNASDEIIEIIDKIDKIQKEYGLNTLKYISDILLYLDWNSISTEYRESIETLMLIKRFSMTQQYGVYVTSVICYDKKYKDKKDLLSNLSNYCKNERLCNEWGIKNSNYYITKCIQSLGNSYLHAEEGLIVSKKDSDYEAILYRYSRNYIKELSNSTRERCRYKLVFSGLKGKYKVSLRTIRSKRGTFLFEWKKIGSPKYLSSEEKEYLTKKVGPELRIDKINAEGTYEKDIELGRYDIMHIRLTKIN